MGNESCFLPGTDVLQGDGTTEQDIETIHVGERVATDGGVANSADGQSESSNPNATQVDRRTWRLVTIHADHILADGTDDTWEVHTLQPKSWLKKHHLSAGSMLSLSNVLDLAEMGVPEGLQGTITSIVGCPNVEKGPGRVVLTTVNHLNDFVYHLTLKGQDGTTETLGVTGYHKFYDPAEGWQSVVDLTVGDTLRGRDGQTVTVTAVTRDAGTHRVYNMTVEADHVYFVGDLTTLTHNNGCGPVVGSGNSYSVGYRTKIPRPAVPTGERAAHFESANQQLFRSMDADASFANSMRTMMPDIDLIRGTDRAPANWVWNHLASEEEVLELVPRVQHWSPNPLWSLFHPKVNGKNIGGHKIWGHKY